MSALTVQLLGTFEALHAEHKVSGFPRRKALALLAYLCLEQPGITHQRDSLASLLWPDTFQEDARRSLRQCLYELRQKLHDHNEAGQSHFEVTAQTVRLRTEQLSCDATEFMRLSGSYDSAQMELALSLHQGEVLAGFNVDDAPTFEEWLFYVRGQLERNLIQLLQRQREQAHQHQDWPRAIAALRRLVALDNLNEELHWDLMQAYFANGERKAALDQYIDCRDLLETELHLSPQPEFTALYNKIKTTPVLQTNTAFTPKLETSIVVATPEAVPIVQLTPTLPTSLTSLIGRVTETQEIKQLLLRPHIRLVTLTGSGGSGKTRLAIEVARELQPAFQDGVCFVPLATLSEANPELIASTIATALGIKESAGSTATQQLTQSLQNTKMLLVLDNFEHIIGAAAFIEDLLKAAPTLKIMITSRFLLKLYGEHEYLVQPLALPDPAKSPPVVGDLLNFPAIALFVERAQAVSHTFDLNVENGPAITEICTRLDGLPLAIELVAARIKFFAPQAMVTRLNKRLALAIGGSRTLTQRQQTLRATIDWSYSLLESHEQQFFNRLSCFIDSFSIKAALAVGSDLAEEDILLELLLGLADKSLLKSSYDTEGEPRFALLETIKEFGLEKLEANNELEKTRGKHAAFFFDLANFDEQVKADANQKKIFALYQQEHANIRATLDWFIAQPDVTKATILSVCLGNFWNVRGYFKEGRTYLRQVLGMTGPVEPFWRARILAMAGLITLSQEDYAEATIYLQESLEVYREAQDKAGVARVLGNLGLIAKHQKDYSLARRLHQESLDGFREMGNKAGTSRSLNNLGQVAILEGELEEAQNCFLEALELRRELGDQNGIAIGLNNMSEVAYHQGKFEIAQAYAEESLSLNREINNKTVMATSLDFLGNIAYTQGALQLARDTFQEQLHLLRELESKNSLALCLNNLGNVSLAQDDYPIARAYFQESLNLYRKLGDRDGAIQSLSGIAHLILAEAAATPQLVATEPQRAIQFVQLAGAVSKLADTDINTREIVLARPPQTNYQKYLESTRATLGHAAFDSAFVEGQSFSLEQVIEQVLVK